jgi:hypothetical protein
MSFRRQRFRFILFAMTPFTDIDQRAMAQSPPGRRRAR